MSLDFIPAHPGADAAGPAYAETQVVAAVLADMDGGRLSHARHLPPEAFTDSICRALWTRILAVETGKPPGMALVNSGLDEAGLRRVSETEFSALNFPGHVATVSAAWLQRRTKAAAAAYQRGHIDLSTLLSELSAANAGAVSREKELAALRFDPRLDPPEQRVLYSIGKVPICTAGNLSAVTAEAKAGKTSWLGAMIAAAMAKDGADCFSLTAHNPAGHALVHIDTETSRCDWHQNLCRAKRRARIDAFPPWLQSYHLTGRTPQQCRRDLEDALVLAAREFGGIFAVFVDGIGDLVFDPNDPEECFPLVCKLHSLAIEFDCAIVNILHRNPGTEKSRGHLGSQLERKCETNLSLEKDDDGNTVVFSLKQRGPAIPKADGPRFRWSDGEAMHVSAESERSAKDRERFGQLADLARDVFGDESSMRYAELQQGIARTANCSERTADARLSEMRRLGVVMRSPPNLYIINPKL